MDPNQKTVEVTVEATNTTFTMNTGELIASARDVLLDQRRQDIAATTWGALSENDQEREIERFTDLAQDLVQSIVDVVATGQFDVIHAKLDNFKIKDGDVTVTSKGRASDASLLALNSVGVKQLKIIVVDDAQFDKHRESVPVDKDEPEMELPGGEDGKPDSDGDVLDAETGELTSAVTAEAVSDERVLGYRCRMQGVDISKNPHEYGSDEGGEWFEGWNSAGESGEAPEIELGKNIDGTFDDVNSPPEDETVENTGSSGDSEVADTGDIPEFLKRNDDGSTKGSDETSKPDPEPDVRGDGMQARKDDLDRSANPYGDETSREHLEWLEGFDAADEQIGELFNAGFAAAENGKGPETSGWKDDTFEHSRWMHGHDDWRKTNSQDDE